MKLYNFTNGDKVGETEYSYYMVPSKEYKFKDSELIFCDSAKRSFGKFPPSLSIPFQSLKNGVKAISFCTGKNSSGQWQWGVIGTPEWKKEMIEAGLLIAKE